MIKANQKKLNTLHVVLDALVVILSYTCGWLVLFLGNQMFSPEKKLLSPEFYFSVLVVLVPLYLLSMLSLYLAFLK